MCPEPPLFLNGAHMSFFVVLLPPSDVYSCLVLEFWDYVWWVLGGADLGLLFVGVWFPPGALT